MARALTGEDLLPTDNSVWISSFRYAKTPARAMSIQTPLLEMKETFRQNASVGQIVCVRWRYRIMGAHVACRWHHVERDSALSHTAVIVFIILISGLLLGAAVKDRFDGRLGPLNLHSWLEVSCNRLICCQRCCSRFCHSR